MHRGFNALDKGVHWQEERLRNSELDTSMFSNQFSDPRGHFMDR